MARGVTGQGSVSSEASVSQGLQLKKTTEVLKKGKSGKSRETGFKITAGKNFTSRKVEGGTGFKERMRIRTVYQRTQRRTAPYPRKRGQGSRKCIERPLSGPETLLWGETTMDPQEGSAPSEKVLLTARRHQGISRYSEAK
ncbi:hypothetical protein ACFL35_20550 [Candidatus Riflebacteria bacterium]